MSEQKSVTVRDDATGQEHRFQISTDAYGVVVTHAETGHAVCFEFFDGRLQVLVFRAAQDVPVHRYTLD